jgi:hypothetical protein
VIRFLKADAAIEMTEWMEGDHDWLPIFHANHCSVQNPYFYADENDKRYETYRRVNNMRSYSIRIKRLGPTQFSLTVDPIPL